MNNKGVPMRVPKEFRKLVRIKSAEEDLNMFQYLKKISRDKKKGGVFDFKF